MYPEEGRGWFLRNAHTHPLISMAQQFHIHHSVRIQPKKTRAPLFLFPFSYQETNYSRPPIIRTLIIRIANYADRLSPSGKHFLPVIVLHLFMTSVSPHLSNTYKELSINVLFVHKKYVA
jgi:hypothetical protein